MKTFEVERPKVDAGRPHLDISQKLTDQRVVEMVNYGQPTPIAEPVGDMYFKRLSLDPEKGDIYTYVTKVDNHGNATVMAQRWVAATGQYEEVRQGGYDQKYSVDALRQGQIDLTEHTITDNKTGKVWKTKVTEWGVSGVTPDRGNSSGPIGASSLAQEFAAKQQVAYSLDKDGRVISGPGVGRSMPVRSVTPPLQGSRGQRSGSLPAGAIEIDPRYFAAVPAPEPRLDDGSFDSLGSRRRPAPTRRVTPARMPAPRVQESTSSSDVPPLKESVKGIAAGLRDKGASIANPESLQIKLGQREEYSESGAAGRDRRNRIRGSWLGRSVMRFKTPEEKAARRAARVSAQPVVQETPVVVARAPRPESRPAMPEPTQVLPDRSQEILAAVGALDQKLEADKGARADEIEKALRIFERTYSLQVAALLSQILDENRSEMRKLDSERREQIQEALRRIGAFEGAMGETNEMLKAILSYLERDQETQQALESSVSQTEIFSGFTQADVADAPIADNELNVFGAESIMLEARDLAESEDLSDGDQAVDAFSALEELAQSLGFIDPEIEDDQPEGDQPLDPAIEAAAAQAWQRTEGDQHSGGNGTGNGRIPVGAGAAPNGSQAEPAGSLVAVLDIPEADEAEAAAASAAQAVPSTQTTTGLKPIWESEGWALGAPTVQDWATGNGGPQSAGFARVAPVAPVTDSLDGRMPLSSAELRSRGGLSGSETAAAGSPAPEARPERESRPRPWRTVTVDQDTFTNPPGLGHLLTAHFKRRAINEFPGDSEGATEFLRENMRKKLQKLGLSIDDETIEQFSVVFRSDSNSQQ